MKTKNYDIIAPYFGTSMPMKLALAFSCLLLSFSAHCFESFAFWSDRKSNGLNTSLPTEISSEYGADLMSFDKEPIAYLEENKDQKYFSTQVGSLSGNEFHQSKTFRLYEKISKRNHLKVLSHQKENFHEKRDFFILAWRYQLSKHWSAGLLGEFAHEKKYDDIGLSLTYEKLNSIHQMYLIFPNYSLNKRNANTDNYKRGSFPKVLSYQHNRIINDSTQSKFSLRIETESLWRFPTDAKQFRHNASYLEWMRSEKTQNYFNKVLGIAIKNEKTTEEDLSNTQSSYKLHSWLQIHYQRTNADQNRFYAYGFEHYTMKYQKISEESSLQYFSPFLRWKNKTSNWSHKIILTSFHALKDREILGFSKSYEKHLRWTADYKLAIKANIDWLWGLSIDLDRLGSDDTWEGGYSKLLWTF